VHLTGPRKGVASCSMLPSCLCLQSLSLYQKWELFLPSIGAKVNGQYCLHILLPQQMLDCVLYKNFVFQQDSTLVHLAFNTVQLLQCKTLNFLSPELWPRNSPKLNFTHYKILGVIQQHEREFQVTTLNKLSHQTLAMQQYSMLFLSFFILPGGAEAPVRFDCVRFR